MKNLAEKISWENEVDFRFNFIVYGSFGKYDSIHTLNNLFNCCIKQYASAILPGGCYIPLPKPTPVAECCPPCNYGCPTKLCPCYFPGTTTLIEPRKAPVRPSSCEFCTVCAMGVICLQPPGECTADQIKKMIKFESD